MEPTESVDPDSRLRLRRVSGAWRRGRSLLMGGRPFEGSRKGAPGQATAADSGTGPAWPPGRASASAHRLLVPGPAQFGTAAGTGGGPSVTGALGEGSGHGLPGPDADRHLSWPALPAVIVGLAGAILGAGFYRAFVGSHALFPAGTVGWSLALLTGIVVGHLVAMGRARWWGGTGSGAALTLAVLLLYGWVAAGMVSLTVVVLVGIARRGRWRQGVLHGAVDILGIGAAALVLRVFGRVPSVERPWDPDSWNLYSAPQVALVAIAYLVVSRVLLWHLAAPRGGLPTVARTALVRQGLLAVALLGIAPLVCVVAMAQPLLLPLFSIPLVALDSTLWIARARAEEQLRDPLTGLPNRQWLLERTWTALDDAERIGARSALVLIDLDRFRSVNDTLGHLAGDRLLLQIADRLRVALPRGAEA
ncbi:MAG TPA: GGDEF domain-containing protein, partial [Streptomyces sp.]|nr:GGDEF domain-containing protein [Streptomyces sp.]